MSGLSPRMRETLLAIRGGMRRDYGTWMDNPTHNALARRGLIEFARGGFAGFPSTWSLTSKGRELADELKKESQP